MEWTALDFWIVVVAMLSAAACAIPGVFLVLRRLSMMGDAISHSVLPGLAAAFLVTGSRESWPMFLGAAATGLATAFLVDFVQRRGRVDSGAAMGVVFTSLFALGLLMIRQAADRVDLDPACVLYGALESTVMEGVLRTWEARMLIAADPSMAFAERMRLWIAAVPMAAWTNGAVLLANGLFLAAFWKELKAAAFDPGFASMAGLRPQVLHYGLMGMTAVTTVAAFEAVGSILVIAMLVAPAATALLLSDRLGVVVVLSLLLAFACAIAGHWAAVAIPHALGLPETNTAGMMAAAAGLFFTAALVLGPSGLAARAVQRRIGAGRILRDDLLAYVYRAKELAGGAAPEIKSADAAQAMRRGRLGLRAMASLMRARGDLAPGGRLELTKDGERRAARLVRRHRLWESYLVAQVGQRSDHVHNTAERLEHLEDPQVVERLERHAGAAASDPHDRPIPEDPERG